MTTRTYPLLRPCLGIGCLVLQFLGAPVGAQDKPDPEYAPKLARTVHLALGKTTLAQALTELSKQTDIRIDAAEYLNDRILVVQMEGLTGRTALNALTALNELKWSAVGPNHLVIDRPTPERPEKITEVPRLLLKALPKDIRDCLLLGIPQKKAWEFATPGAFTINPDFEFPMFIATRGRDMIYEQYRLFEAGLPAVLPVGTKIPFRTLTPAHESELLAILFFRELGRLSSNLLRDNLPPYLKDIMQASLHFHSLDNLLEIGTITHQGDTETYQFFGAPIAPPPPAGEKQSGKNP